MLEAPTSKRSVSRSSSRVRMFIFVMKIVMRCNIYLMLLKAVDRGVVKEDDFYLQEKSFIDLLIKDKEIKQLWDDFRQLNCVYKGKIKNFL